MSNGKALILAVSALALAAVIPLCWHMPATGQRQAQVNLAGQNQTSLEDGHRCPGCNVVLLTLDTTRKEHLGCYGYAHNTTPNIDSLALKSTVLTRMMSSAPITLPSHASILTSLYPFQFGVRDNWLEALGDNVETLPEILNSSGFRTGAFVGSFVLDRRFNLDQGFGTYDDKMTLVKKKSDKHPIGQIDEPFERRGSDVTDAAIKWLNETHTSQFFLWVHYFDPHLPYSPPDGYALMFPSQTPEYDGEIRYVDDQIGRLYKFIEGKGMLNNTLIIVVADHGEGLRDHGEVGHGKMLMDTTINVPAILFNPRDPREKRIDRITETVDIAPTILDILGAPPGKCMQGRSIYRPDASEPGRAAYSETFFGLREGEVSKTSLRTEKYRYVRQSDGKEQLFDLAVGPAENAMLWGDFPRMRRAIDRFINSRRDCLAYPVYTGFDENAYDKLKALGYVA